MSVMDGFLAFALVVSAIAAVIDWRTGEIPQGLTFGPLILAPVAHFIAGMKSGGPRLGLTMAGFSVAGALVCGAVPYLMWLITMHGEDTRPSGGGDVKLLAAIGAMLLPMIGIEAEMYAFIGAALFAPAKLAWEGKLMRTLGNTAVLAINPFLPKARRRKIAGSEMTMLRFAPAIFFGVALETVLHWRGL